MTSARRRAQRGDGLDTRQSKRPGQRGPNVGAVQEHGAEPPIRGDVP